MKPIQTVNRREFLAGTFGLMPMAVGLAVGGSAEEGRAAEPVVRNAESRLRMGLAAYSFRDQLVDQQHTPKAGEVVPKPSMTLAEFVDFSAAQGCDGVELTSYYFPKDFDHEFLIDLKRRAFVNGMVVSGSAVGNRFTLPRGPERDKEIAYVKRWIDHTATMGASHLRVFAGEAGKLELAEARRLCVEALENCCEYAGARGVFLGLENHGGIVADPEGLLGIVQSVRSRWLGVNLDTGNFRTVDPYADLVKCAPYAVNVQIKSEIQPKGERSKKDADLDRLIRILKDSGYRGFVTLEYEAEEDPKVAVPRLLSRVRKLIN